MVARIGFWCDLLLPDPRYSACKAGYESCSTRKVRLCLLRLLRTLGLFDIKLKPYRTDERLCLGCRATIVLVLTPQGRSQGYHESRTFGSDSRRRPAVESPAPSYPLSFLVFLLLVSNPPGVAFPSCHNPPAIQLSLARFVGHSGRPGRSYGRI
jgi:hypothetical protein